MHSLFRAFFSFFLTLAANDLTRSRLSERLKQACTCSSCVQSRSKGSLRHTSPERRNESERDHEGRVWAFVWSGSQKPIRVLFLYLFIFKYFFFNIWVVTIRSRSSVTAQITVRKKEMFSSTKLASYKETCSRRLWNGDRTERRAGNNSDGVGLGLLFSPLLSERRGNSNRWNGEKEECMA